MATLLGTQQEHASWRDYLELTKPRVVVLMLITSLVGMFLATRAGVAWPVLVFVGIMFASIALIFNALAPGYIVTDINREFFAGDAGEALKKRIPMRRAGELDDLDGPLLLLCSEAGRYMTGSVVAVDGGHLVSGL